MKKKILIITTVGGFLTQFEKNDVEILSQLGYEIHYASNFDHTVYAVDEKFLETFQIKTHHIHIKKYPKSIVSNFRAWMELIHILKTENIYAIHCHNPMGGVLARIAANTRGHRRPFVMYTAHGFHFYKGAPIFNWICYYPVEFLLAQLTDILITINQEDYLRAQSFYRRENKKRVKYIPGVGVDIHKFSQRKDGVISKKKELGIPLNRFVIFSVGEVNDNKNHQLILQALQEIDYQNIFYGICGQGEAIEELGEKIKQLHLENYVKLYGYRNDIPEILCCADLFAFPSKREGFGIAAIEAMATGIPVVAANSRGTREYMIDQVNGFICNVNDKKSFSNAINILLKNPIMRKQMGEQARIQAEKFSIEETGSIMKEIYQSIT